MIRSIKAASVLLLALAGWVVPGTVRPPEPTPHARVDEAYGRVPLAFEADATDGDFRARARGGMLRLSPNEAVFELGAGKRVRMRLAGGNPAPRPAACDPLPWKTNYLIGTDPRRWRTGIATFAGVEYRDVYPGVDLVYHGSQRELEYDFVVAPGASAAEIALSFDAPAEIDAAGDLVVRSLRQKRPRIYQDIGGARRAVAGGWAMRADGFVGFDLGEYDGTHPLVIDPVLVYSTYLGGSGSEQPHTIAVDSTGSAYITGITGSSNFPTVNPLQASRGDATVDAFVAKLNASGTALVYSTYLGGNATDDATAIAVDSAGNAYVAGFTESTNFPAVNALQSSKRGGVDAFVAKLNPTGTALVYSTYLGGTADDFASGISVGSDGSVYVSGLTTSTNFPTAGALQSANRGASDAFVAKLNASGSQVVYASYLGGRGQEAATSIAVDSAGNALVSGLTTSGDFPTAAPFQPNYGGGAFDGFVAKVNAAGSALVYSTYLGGSGTDRAFRLAVDAAGNAYVVGDTDSTNFPKVAPLQPSLGGAIDAFITKLGPTGAVLFSTYLGGGGTDAATSVAVDAAGSAHVTGATSSTNFPAVGAVATSSGGAFDVFVAKLNPAGSALTYATYLGGSDEDIGFAVALDTAGNAYVIGQSASLDFPAVGALQSAHGGGTQDSFVVKLSPQIPATQTTLYFPRLVNALASGIEADDSESTGIAVVNLGTSSATLTLTAFDTAGARIAGGAVNPAVRTLQPGQQVPVATAQVFGSSVALDRVTGWFKLESTVRQTVGFFLSYSDRLSFLDGADASTAPVNTFVFPEIEDQGYTHFHAVNPGAAAARLTFELIKSDGMPRIPSFVREVKASGALAESFGEIFSGVRPFASDYLRVTSTVGVIPFEFLGKSNLYAMGLNGQDASAGATVLYSPQYVVGGGAYRSTLSVINLENTAGTVTFELIRDDGTAVGVRPQLSIAGRGKIAITDQSFFVNAGGALTQGYVRITSSGPKLAGSVVFGDPARAEFAAALPLVSRLLTAFVFGQVASNATYFTGVALLNPGTAAGNATLDVYDAAGARVATKVEALAAGTRKSQLLTQYFPALAGQNRASGYIRVTSDRPLAGFALFGTNDLSVLSAIPPQIVP